MDIGIYGARGIPSTYSGYETFLTVLLPELAARGHEVTIYCRRDESSEESDYLGVRRVLLPSIKSKQLDTLSHGFLSSLRARFARHDIVFVVNVANAIFCLLARVSGQRTVLNTDGQEWLRGKWGHAARGFFRLSAHIAGIGSSALVSDSREMRRIYLQTFRANSTVIPYCWTQILGNDDGSDMTISDPPQDYFLIAGRLVPENNIDRVAEAYCRSNVTTPLIILGEANYDSPVKRRLDELAASCPKIILAGHISNRSEFARLVSQASIYLHAHSVGGINPSLIEAMGTGARILALDTAFNREALGAAGDYFHNFQTELPELFKILQSESDAARNSQRQAAMDRARCAFGRAHVVDAHEALFFEVLRKRPWRRTVIETRWSAVEENKVGYSFDT